MSSLPMIAICTASVILDARLVLQVMGRGDNEFSRKMCVIDPNATWETPPTHYGMQDMSATDAYVVLLNSLIDGTLPEEDENGNTLDWESNGLISGADALAAFASPNVKLFTASGLVDEPTEGERTPTQWRDDVFEDEGLQFVPDEPI